VNIYDDSLINPFATSHFAVCATAALFVAFVDTPFAVAPF
jgi:hypothetical protein